jgi:hypothetical protein
MTIGHRLGRPKQRKWKGSQIRREIIVSIEMGKVPTWKEDIPWSKIRMKTQNFETPGLCNGQR